MKELQWVRAGASPVTFSNTGSTTITILAVSQSAVGFDLSGLNLPLTLAPGQKAQFIVTFTPLGLGMSLEISPSPATPPVPPFPFTSTAGE